MELINNLGNLINTSFNSCIYDKQLKKYFVITTIIYLIYTLGLLFLTASVFNADYLSTIESQNFVEFLPQFFSYIGFIILSATVIGLIFTLIGFLTIKKGLELTKRKTKEIDLITFIKFIFIGLIQFFYAFFSIFNLKLFLIFILGAILILIGILSLALNPIFGAILSGLGILVIFGYFLIVIYNTYRLIFTEIAFVETGEIKKGLNTSWKLTKGKIIEIFLTLIIIGVILTIILVIFDLPNSIYSLFIGALTTSSATEINSFYLFNDPIYLILQIPAIVVTSFSLIFTNILLVNIYVFLDKKKQKK